ncbi:hypothetical protein A374_03319 [Fictibacillus macauensis ZFHKF-1]|uniref:Protease PrsW n=1 Tax=Fictibacillus macauensis ZFHKF-1 TaxID=1196324 RepID=I8UIC0_9BACL|nr:glutamic-type intramembrane protease PrsW [Fictibacillus macauensis]EIT86568.1 hypothetical protein A374_03319 [Fictibacillus macauensis ZFHKF-1]
MLGIIAAGMAPALALLCFFYLKDQYETEPLSVVMRLFVVGMVLVFPAMLVDFGMAEEFSSAHVLNAFFVSPVVEEGLKWCMVLLLIYKHAEFNEPYDGIVYSVALSLGFASLENIVYLYVHGVHEAFLRSILPVSGHALFAVISGYYVGKAKFSRNHNKLFLLLSLLIPVILHSVYNWILATFTHEWLFVMLPFMLFLWWNGLRKVKKANASKRVWLAQQEKISS